MGAGTQRWWSGTPEEQAARILDAQHTMNEARLSALLKLALKLYDQDLELFREAIDLSKVMTSDHDDLMVAIDSALKPPSPWTESKFDAASYENWAVPIDKSMRVGAKDLTFDSPHQQNFVMVTTITPNRHSPGASARRRQRVTNRTEDDARGIPHPLQA